MGQQTLQHCDEVEIDPPPAGMVNFSAGSPGDGVVEISIERGGPPPEVHQVPCGPPTPVDFNGASRVTMHYRQSPQGPSSVTATW